MKKNLWAIIIKLPYGLTFPSLSPLSNGSDDLQSQTQLSMFVTVQNDIYQHFIAIFPLGSTCHLHRKSLFEK
jgi:hypothetical protein